MSANPPSTIYRFFRRYPIREMQTCTHAKVVTHLLGDTSNAAPGVRVEKQVCPDCHAFRFLRRTATVRAYSVWVRP